MEITTSTEGCFDVKVEVIHGHDSTHTKVKEYVIDGSGVHFMTDDDIQHFIPHQNIKWLTVREHDDGEW